MKKSINWIIGYLLLTIGALTVLGGAVIKIDPFFHYHKPILDVYYYRLSNQRSQNDGIIKNFDYDALITGTSMTENFKTTELDAIFGTHSIKVPYSGATFKEINDNIRRALEHNPNLRMVVRGLDMAKFFEDKDAMRFELGEYPTYLYDNIWCNDVNYIFNRDVFFKWVYPMATERDVEGFTPGITSFDSYSAWTTSYSFGPKTVCPNGFDIPANTEQVHLSENEKDTVYGTTYQNIISLANEYPDVTFYYFFTPYSIAWWGGLVNTGSIYKQIEAEQLIIEEILKYGNIKLYSFNNMPHITTDLNNYMDLIHYAPWINSLILYYIKAERGLITYENYLEYLDSELEFYTTYDYSLLNDQTDYENDLYAAVLLNSEISNVTPINILNMYRDSILLNQAELLEDQYNGQTGIQCSGSISRELGSKISVPDYIFNYDYVGARLYIEDISKYRYLVFYGKKDQDHGQPGVYIYDQNNTLAAAFSMVYPDLDNQWHEYAVDVTGIYGPVTIIFNGSYTDNTGSSDSLYTFSNIILY